MTPKQAIAAAKANGLAVTDHGPANLGMLRLPKHKAKSVATGAAIRWAIEFSIPCVVVSEANMRGTWAKGWRRRKEQREALYGALLTLGLQFLPRATGYRVTWTKVGGKSLDKEDNLPISFKGLRDDLTSWMGFDSDDDPALEWCYSQRLGEPGVEVRIESRSGQ